MAAGNPVVKTDLFGENWTAYTDGLGVYVGSDLTDDYLAFEQLVEDSPIGFDINHEGVQIITYLDVDGNRLQSISLDDGDSWS